MPEANTDTLLNYAEETAAATLEIDRKVAIELLHKTDSELGHLYTENKEGQPRVSDDQFAAFGETFRLYIQERTAAAERIHLLLRMPGDGLQEWLDSAGTGGAEDVRNRLYAALGVSDPESARRELLGRGILSAAEVNP